MLATAGGGIRFIGYTAVLGQPGGLRFTTLLSVIVIMTLYHLRRTPLPKHGQLLFSSATLLLLVPALTGYSYAAYYLWAVAVALLAIAIVLNGGGAEATRSSGRKKTERTRRGAPSRLTPPDSPDVKPGERPRILLVVPDYPPASMGGGAHYFQNLANEYTLKGCEVRALSLDVFARPGFLARPARKTRDHVEAVYLPLMMHLAFRNRLLTAGTAPSIPAIAAAFRTVLTEKWDGVHVHGPPMIPWCDCLAFLAKLRGFNLVLTIHLVERDPWSSGLILGVLYKVTTAMESLLYRKVAGVAFVSNHLKTQGNHQGLRFEREFIIPLPEDESIKRWAMRRNLPSHLLGLGLMPRKYVLAIGSLIPRKGQEVLLRAIATLHSQHRVPEGFLFVIAGTDLGTGYAKHLEAICHAEGLGAYVRFTGHVTNSEREALYQNCAGLVFTSFDEGSPTVVIEALERGIPILASNIPPVRELAERWPGLLTFQPGRHDELAAKLSDYLTDRGNDERSERLPGHHRTRKRSLSMISAQYLHLLLKQTKQNDDPIRGVAIGPGGSEGNLAVAAEPERGPENANSRNLLEDVTMNNGQ